MGKSRFLQAGYGFSYHLTPAGIEFATPLRIALVSLLVAKHSRVATADAVIRGINTQQCGNLHVLFSDMLFCSVNMHGIYKHD